MLQKPWNIYLAGEIHTPWRDEIKTAISKKKINATTLGPETDHERSDYCGDLILGPEENSFWKDHKAAKINAIRNRKGMEAADIVVVRFGDKYRQWNASFDAGIAYALGKSIITYHDSSLDHALKEVDSAALVVARSVQQIIATLEYVISEA